MSTEAANFIVKLATDPVLVSRYEADPTQVLNESGLSPTDVAVLSSRDANAIRRLVAAGSPRLGNGPKKSSSKTKKGKGKTKKGKGKKNPKK